ncbi:putative uncharacterized protein DDB_G0293878 [Microplitis mediator]|uniref:putative uncharacterized protein DDB_G0293878 n=1 Tax=Microplitis mediator TaxID=375433 RepID=UPI002552D41D|nr:putative uncharacterized protein DDB_G0293878 [Microplitis mediator]
MKLTVLVILITQVHLFSCQKSRRISNPVDHYQEPARYGAQELPPSMRRTSPAEDGPKESEVYGLKDLPNSRRGKMMPGVGSRGLVASRLREIFRKDTSPNQQIIIITPPQNNPDQPHPSARNLNSATDSSDNEEIELPSHGSDDLIITDNDPALSDTEVVVQSASRRSNSRKSNRNKNINVNNNANANRQFDYSLPQDYPEDTDPEIVDYPTDLEDRRFSNDDVQIIRLGPTSRSTRRRLSDNRNTNVNTNVNTNSDARRRLISRNRNTNVNTNVNTNNEARRRSLNDNKNVNVNINNLNADNADDETATNDVEAGNADGDNVVEANDDTIYGDSVVSPVSVISRRSQGEQTLRADDSNGKSRRGSRRSKTLDPSASQVQSRRNLKSVGSSSRRNVLVEVTSLDNDDNSRRVDDSPGNSYSRRNSEAENSGKRRKLVIVGDSPAAYGLDDSDNQISGSRRRSPTIIVSARRFLRNRNDNKNININNNVNDAAVDDDIKVSSRRRLTSSGIYDDNAADGISSLVQQFRRHRARTNNENKNVNINVNRLDSAENV